ncbi:hypothetical protein PYW07_011674 [Mythimna separata]|uniref:Uncharacterized protein n=1 Tax=Mythimna separata TaxID=271217 RepID=A0AAD8DKL2_MYTSE|nr:hypothetical protein PYW07_011674 [Mythimna separata]
MSSFTVQLLCIQACLIQNVFGSCGCGAPMAVKVPAAPCGGAYGLGAYGGAFGSAYGGALAPAAAYGSAMAPGAAYGGEGEGNVVVFGELPVAGNTALAGQVPIMGVVNFGGAAPACGAVSISGKCSCGCY